MSFNFITPVSSHALFDTPRGGKLFEPLFQLTCGIADLFIKGMQYIFMGTGDINQQVNLDGEQLNSQFNIKYSPGAIFSNKVPTLDVNFFNPGKSYTSEIKNVSTELVGQDGDESYSVPSNEIGNKKKKLVSNYGYYNSSIQSTDLNSAPEIVKQESEKLVGGMSANTICEKWTDSNNVTYYYLQTETSANVKVSYDLSGKPYVDNNGQASLTKFTYNLRVFKENASITTGKTIQSSASTLQKTVATWYKALRAFALVGLLSVLVYIGIRILISSTGQEKAKYKKMVVDWVAAICILFVLQYIMVFTLEITDRITGVLRVNVIETDANGNIVRDNLISDLRGNVGGDDETDITYTEFETFINTIMYIALVIETGIFSVHYLKRLVYMAFFTMIAPLIALTYPLDKIKDGQAQAFGMWIREYVFNALIQPVHLLLYYVFITSAIDLASGNPLYAVVALGFMMPAEKFFRKMFGFEKASSVSQVGAAAGGALVMNAINKMGQRAGKQAGGKASAGGSGSSGSSASGTRTADGSALAALSGGGSTAGPQPYSGQPLSGAPGMGPTGGGFAGGGSTGGNIATSKNKGSAIKGVKNIAKKQLFTRQAAQRNLRAMAGVAGGVIGGTIGIGAGIATGDLSKVGTYGAAGAGAGFMGAKGLVNGGFNTYDSAVKLGDNIAYDYQTGALGEEEANNRKFDREFRRSEDYKKMLSNYGDGAKGDIQQMLNAGITDPARMNTILKNMNKYGTDVSHAMAFNQLANDCSDSVLYDDKKLRMFLDKRGIKQDVNSMRDSIINFK